MLKTLVLILRIQLAILCF